MRTFGLRPRAGLALLATTLTLATLSTGATGASAAPGAPPDVPLPPQAAVSVGKLRLLPPLPPQAGNLPQRAVRNMPKLPPVAAPLRAAHAADPVDLKVLVISADGQDGQPNELVNIERELQRIGVPFDVLIASQHTLNGTSYVSGGQPLDQALAQILSNGVAPSAGGHGYYQGIMLTTGSLWLPNFTSAFTAAEWNALAAYEASFRIRQVTDYTSTVGGPSSYCLSYTGEQATSPSNLVTGTLTSAGQAVFAYLQPNVSIPINYSYVYKALADPTNTANNNTLVPLVTASDGSILVSTCTFADGRENLAMTFANNPNDGPDVNFLHSLLLSYGVVNWVTRGHFLGTRHPTQDIQPDDLYLADDIWNPSFYVAYAQQTNTLPYVNPGIDCVGGTPQQCPTVRNTGSDVTFWVNWQKSSGVTAVAPQFRFEFPFVGEGETGIYDPDTLSPAMDTAQPNFNFVSHTYTHLNLDQNCVTFSTTFPETCTKYQAPTVSQIVTELNKNHKIATTDVGFDNYFKDSFVNPDISGLSSANAQQALRQFGIKYQISDSSRPGQNNPSPNAGIYNALQPSILEIPRRASNLFYNLYRPDDWVAEYNCFYYQGGIVVNGQTVHCGDATFDQFRYLTAPIDYAGIIDHESNALLSYLLKWDIDPIMFHTPNLQQYQAGSTLLTDLLNATFQKYRALYQLPVRNLPQHQVGIEMANRMAYNGSGITASMVPCGTTNATPSVTLKSPVALSRVPITGVNAGTSPEQYGGQWVSYVTLAANAPKTVPLLCP